MACFHPRRESGNVFRRQLFHRALDFLYRARKLTLIAGHLNRQHSGSSISRERRTQAFQVRGVRDHLGGERPDYNLTRCSEENGGSLLIKLPEPDALLLQPPVEISHQSDLLPTILWTVTLARKQSGEAFDVRPQRANPQVARFFGFRIKMNHQ